MSRGQLVLDELMTRAILAAAEVEGVSPEEWLTQVICDALGKRLSDLELDEINAQAGSEDGFLN